MRTQGEQVESVAGVAEQVNARRPGTRRRPMIDQGNRLQVATRARPDHRSKDRVVEDSCNNADAEHPTGEDRPLA